MCHSRVIDNEICFHAKEALNTYNLFNTRYTLFKQVYTHRAGKSIEYMVTDALVEADVAWNRKLSKAAMDPKLYEGLTDNILRSIEFAPNEDGNLDKAKSIVRRIRKRDLYAFVDEILIPRSIAKILPKVTATDITSFHSNNGSVQLTCQDIVVQDFSISWCNKERDPAENINYYKTGARDEKKFRLHQSKVAQLLPTHFQERIVRVFLRDKNDFNKLTASSAALRKFLRDKERNVGALNGRGMLLIERLCLSASPPLSLPLSLSHSFDTHTRTGPTNDMRRQVSETPHHLSRIHLSPSRPRRSATIHGVSDFRKSLLSGKKYTLSSVATPPRLKRRRVGNNSFMSEDGKSNTSTSVILSEEEDDWE